MSIVTQSNLEQKKPFLKDAKIAYIDHLDSPTQLVSRHINNLDNSSVNPANIPANFTVSGSSTGEMIIEIKKAPVLLNYVYLVCTTTAATSGNFTTAAALSMVKHITIDNGSGKLLDTMDFAAYMSSKLFDMSDDDKHEIYQSAGGSSHPGGNVVILPILLPWQTDLSDSNSFPLWKLSSSINITLEFREIADILDDGATVGPASIKFKVRSILTHVSDKSKKELSKPWQKTASYYSYTALSSLDADVYETMDLNNHRGSIKAIGILNVLSSDISANDYFNDAGLSGFEISYQNSNVIKLESEAEVRSFLHFFQKGNRRSELTNFTDMSKFYPAAVHRTANDTVIYGYYNNTDAQMEIKFRHAGGSATLPKLVVELLCSYYISDDGVLVVAR